MTFKPSNAISTFLPLEFIPPDDMDEFKLLISKREAHTANIVNSKENGNYENGEILSGQQWFSTVVSPTPKTLRYTFRKVVVFGALPNTATKTIAHGITIDANTIFTRIYATANTPNTSFIPIPYINTGTPGDSVELSIDTTNVNITTTSATYTGYTTTYVVLEYLKG